MPVKTIVVTYYVSNQIDISIVEASLSIKWSDVEDYEVRWNTLHLYMKDGSAHEYHPDTYPDGAGKHPVHVHEYDEHGCQC